MQPDLFGDAPSTPGPYDRAPAVRHSRTSVAAADAIEPHTGGMRVRVLEYLRSLLPGGATDLEGMAATGLGQTYRPRRIELMQAGQVRDSGTTRATASGRQATVWVATA